MQEIANFPIQQPNFIHNQKEMLQARPEMVTWQHSFCFKRPQTLWTQAQSYSSFGLVNKWSVYLVTEL